MLQDTPASFVGVGPSRPGARQWTRSRPAMLDSTRDQRATDGGGTIPRLGQYPPGLALGVVGLPGPAAHPHRDRGGGAAVQGVGEGVVGERAVRVAVAGVRLVGDVL